MPNKKTTSPKEEEPAINIVDRRSALLEEDELNQISEQEERLPSYVEKLKKEAEEKDQKLKDYIAAYKEKTAEDDGFRKRLEKDNDVRLDQFKANLFSRLVPILDNLNRAIQAASTNRDFDGLNQGVELVSKQFSRELKNNNVEIIDAKPRGVFERSAIRALYKYKFKPQIIDGKPQAQTVTQTLEYSLDKG